MYHGKHTKARKTAKRPVILLASLAMILAAVAAGTLAFLVAPSGELVNTFAPAKVEGEVQETTEPAEDGDVLVKENVTVKNTGDVSCYIRAKILITWVDHELKPHGQVPVANTDYEMQLNVGDKWIAKDGYYYYTEPVAAGEMTVALIEECTAMDTEPEGYKLSVEILSQCIQAEPTDAVEQAWGFVPGT